MSMSLIHTCKSHGASSCDDLNQLQIHTVDVTKSPDRWMPWNYRENIRGVSGAV
jgi:transposase